MCRAEISTCLTAAHQPGHVSQPHTTSAPTPNTSHLHATTPDHVYLVMKLFLVLHTAHNSCKVYLTPVSQNMPHLSHKSQKVCLYFVSSISYLQCMSHTNSSEVLNSIAYSISGRATCVPFMWHTIYHEGLLVSHLCDIKYIRKGYLCPIYVTYNISGGATCVPFTWHTI